MSSKSELSEILGAQWRNTRRLTYDYLDMLEPSHLSLTLPFPESQSIGYQFRCMLGAQESYLRKLQSGEWPGFSSSLDDFDPVTPDIIMGQMVLADRQMEELIHALDLQARLKNGQRGYEIVQRIIEHELHHHGQLINFMFCHRLPIPDSWQDEWALAYE